jgi:hypothetical protein
MRHLVAGLCLALGLWLTGCCWGHDCDEGEPSYSPEPAGGPARTDGQSCDGSYLCEYGLIPVLEGPVGADSCVCRWACVPGEDVCPSADRVCTQLEDDAGAAIPGQGACEPLFVAARGEPCGPQQCETGDICAGYSPDTAYCRAQCDPDLLNCALGYECTLVAEYDDPSITACLPVVGEVVEGAACTLEAACAPGLFCVTTVAGSACRPACDPWAPVCATGSTCLRVEDPTMQTYGYACVPGA